MTYIEVLEKKIYNVDSKICNLIDDYKLFKDPVRLADYVVQFLRTYVEHVAARLYADSHPEEKVIITYKDHNITKYHQGITTKKEYRFLKELLDSLQITVSHFVPEDDGATRLMVMYLPKLYQLRDLMKAKFDMHLLHNLDDYPVEMDENLIEYYGCILSVLQSTTKYNASISEITRYYIADKHYKIINGKCFFEYNLVYARRSYNKFERLVAYSLEDIPDNYALCCEFAAKSINYNGILAEIRVIT